MFGKDMVLVVLFDFGLIFIYFLDLIVLDIYNKVDVFYDQNSGIGYVFCDIVNQDM